MAALRSARCAPVRAPEVDVLGGSDIVISKLKRATSVLLLMRLAAGEVGNPEPHAPHLGGATRRMSGRRHENSSAPRSSFTAQPPARHRSRRLRVRTRTVCIWDGE